MPRLRRLLATGEIFFVTTNLQRTLPRFTHAEQKALCETLQTLRQRRDFRLAAFVIMPDHVHFLILPETDDSISAIIQQWKRLSAAQINRLRSRRGQLWQKGFFDRYMRTPKEMMETLEYIHTNPVRKKLAKTSTDWVWSSASAYEGGTCPVPVDFLDLPAQGEKRFT